MKTLALLRTGSESISAGARILILSRILASIKSSNHSERVALVK
jgi:hypothetical protein